MNEMTQPYPRAQALPVSWFQFATKHRASIASLVVLVFPLVMPFTALAANILIYGLYALGFNLVYGYLGLLSFGHAALFGTGAYFCGIAIVHFGLPWFAAIALGIAGGLAMAALIGVLAIRTRGIYFAMVTLALSQCVYYLFYQAIRLDRRREWPAWNQCPRHRYFRHQAGFHQSTDPLLCDRRIRDRGVLRAVADPGVAIWRRNRSGP